MRKISKNQFHIDQVTIQKICSFFVFAYVFLMAVVFPFYLTSGYRYAGTDKAMLFRFIGQGFLILLLPFSLIYFCLSIFKEGKEFWKQISLSDYFMCAYLIVTIVSYMFSENKKEAFWGTDGWYIGFMTQVIYVGSYFFISRFLKGEKILVFLFLCSTSVSFLLGILNRFSIYPLKLEGANPSFIATLGNINWYCGYWSIFFPFAVGLFYMIKKEQFVLKIFLGFYLALAGMAGALQGSDSALLVFGLVLLAVYFLSGKSLMRRKRFYETLIVLNISFQIVRFFRWHFPEAVNYDSRVMDLLTGGNLTFFVMMFSLILWFVVNECEKKELKIEKILLFARNIVMTLVFGAFFVFLVLLVSNTVHPGSIGMLSDEKVFIFNEKWGSSRGVTWMAGIKTFQDQSFLHKLIGLGPDCFAYGVYKEGSSAVQMVKAIFGESILTNAHNEWITVLVNFGVLGLYFYAGTFLLKCKRFLSNGVENAMVFASGLSLVGYMSNNLFSFQQVLNGPFIFIVMGIGEFVFLQNQSKS